MPSGATGCFHVVPSWASITSYCAYIPDKVHPNEQERQVMVCITRRISYLHHCCLFPFPAPEGAEAVAVTCPQRQTRLSRTIWGCKRPRIPAIARFPGLQNERCSAGMWRNMLLNDLPLWMLSDVLIADHSIIDTMLRPFEPVRRQAWRGTCR